MSTTLQDKNIIFCGACAKPIAGEYYTIKNKLHGKEIWHYHMTVDECANAPAIKKDWRRIARREEVQTHNGIKARLQEGDGYSWDTDDSVPMR